jgi:hypothetical protein
MGECQTHHAGTNNDDILRSCFDHGAGVVVTKISLMIQRKSLIFSNEIVVGLRESKNQQPKVCGSNHTR